MKRVAAALLFLSVALYAGDNKGDNIEYAEQQDRYAECDVRLDECSEICDKKDESDTCYSSCQKEYDDCADKVDIAIAEQ